MPVGVSGALLLLLLLLCLQNCDSDHLLFPHSRSGRLVRPHDNFTIVVPEKVDVDGRFISHVLPHRLSSSGGRRRRDTDEHNSKHVYYKLNFYGQDLTLNLTVNQNLLSHGYVLERRLNNVSEHGHQTRSENQCYLIGTVTDGDVEGTAALSTCSGLTGLLTLPAGVFLIEPVKGHTPTPSQPQHPHVIYTSSSWTELRTRRSASSRPQRPPHSACGVKDSEENSQQERELWERGQQDLRDQNQRRTSRRSVSTERWVETLVVADSKVLQYHGNDNVESYIFTIMNMVAGIFHDASIGNAIHIVLVRLILLQGEEKGLKIVHHADSTLSSFCSWQKNLNPVSDTHPAHHDVAVLLTRKDICAGGNQPCETLGLSHLSGMCQPHRSCNINEDSGLPVAFTIAHELGHSFGIQHDGQGNDCEAGGRQPFIMSRQLQYDSSPLTWSTCSKEYITHFLDRGWGSCLDDRPSKKDLTTALIAPGVRYTRQHQCQMQYGPNATFCPEIENVCQILWCSVNSSCRSKLDAPIDGTRCGPGKWCISGECVLVGKLPETKNGGWGQWSTWSHCSRTCGSGVQSAERECDQPKPAFGGRYCTGERRRYRICNTAPCAKQLPSFREMQCSEFDTVPYHNQLYRWIPVSNNARPCELQCKPEEENFSERMLEAVTDGTPCFSNSSSSVCINGVCKAVGCDYGIDSRAEQDSCGVCLGDGSSCESVHDTYEQRDGHGYVDVILIPEGARNILVQEVEEAGNFLVMRAADSDRYYLNGNYLIQWNGEYQVGGAKFYYERSGNLENLTSPGPTTTALMVQLLFQEYNPGIRYTFTVKKNPVSEGNRLQEPVYTWKHGAWTHCSATCGSGEQQQPVRCFRAGVGVVSEESCDPSTRPEEKHRQCKNMDCPARWWVGGWQPCSASCGPTGTRKRTVLCVRTVDGEERVLHPADCRNLPKPKPAVACNRDVTCGSAWAVGNWSQCSMTCGGGVKSRTVTCGSPHQSRCDPAARPRSTTFCNLQSCPKTPPEPPPPPSTPAPRHRPDEATPTSAMPTVSTAHTPTPSVLHPDDGDLILVRNDRTETTTPPTHTHTAEEDEEGSSDPDRPHPGPPYTPGYDYITDDGPETPVTLHTPVTSTHTHAYLTTPTPSMNTHLQTHSVGITHIHTQKVLRNRPGSDTPVRTHGVVKNDPGTNTGGFWVVGNWSECSTSCGLGAVWRSVVCSSGQDSDCSSSTKPEPAKYCNLQPCAVWRKCVSGCRDDLQCMDSQSGRVLRPFHCSGQRPPPSPEWRSSSWGECSQSCGGGVEVRDVHCVDEPSGEHVPPSLCPENNKPDTERPCNVEKCKPAPGAAVCTRNSVSTHFCSRLKFLGRCALPSIQKQCCITCGGYNTHPPLPKKNKEDRGASAAL
ncbi:A disintegrin and metalloproteinase with thrombospondin motifs 12 [Trichomycterus rosablanca]|uniref:A disintegrin and metalloproteinase with thrombospondin motifs 12 n=1 Tax=Trichomycterus rosablanca TaxID=2290929 RepID=UPI002F35038B